MLENHVVLFTWVRAHVKPVAILSNDSSVCTDQQMSPSNTMLAVSIGRIVNRSGLASFSRFMWSELYCHLLLRTNSSKASGLPDTEVTYLTNYSVWPQVTLITYQSREQFSYTSIKWICCLIYKSTKYLIYIIFLTHLIKLNSRIMRIC